MVQTNKKRHQTNMGGNMSEKRKLNKQTGDNPYGAFFRELRQKQGDAQEGILQIKTLLTFIALANGEISAEEIYVPHLARILGILVDKIDRPLQEMDTLIINQKGLEEFCDKVECQRNKASLSIHKIRTILALLDGHDTSVKDLHEAGIDLCSIRMVLQDFTDKADDCVDEIDGLIIECPDKEKEE
jgi:hypothetical protein